MVTEYGQFCDPLFYRLMRDRSRALIALKDVFLFFIKKKNDVYFFRPLYLSHKLGGVTFIYILAMT